MEIKEPRYKFEALPPQYTAHPATLRIPGHLTGAITPDDSVFLLSDAKKVCSRHRRLARFLKHNNFTSFIYDICPSPWACLKRYMEYTYYTPNSDDLITKYHLALDVALRIYEIEARTTTPLVPHTRIKETIARVSSHLSHSELLLSLYELKIKAETLKDIVINAKLVPGIPVQVSENLLADNEVFFFECQQHGRAIGPTNLFLGLLDICQTRFSLHLYWMIKSQFLPGSGLFHRGHAIIKILESLWPVLGEDLFTVLKNWDSYVIGKICADTEDDLGFRDLYDTARIEILTKYPQFETSGLAHLWIHSTKNEQHMRDSLELSTLARSFGHPLLSTAEGIASLREKARENVPTNSTTIIQNRCMWVKMFIKGYVEKEHKWPSVSLSPEIHPTIHKAYTRGRWVTEAEDIHIDILEWNNIQFLKTFTYDMSIDTTELLSDKSCSPRLSKWTQKYDPCGFVKNDQVKPRFDPDDTRVMIHYLKGVPQIVEKNIRRLEESGPDPENDIAFQTRKERELKSKGGRTYCTQTFNQRTIQTSRESNIKKYIFRYLPTQTMSDTELQLNKKIGGFLSVQLSNGEILNLDLKNWNMFQRPQVNQIIAKDLDNLFGMKRLFIDGHLWLQRCYVFNSSRVNPPLIGSNNLPSEGEFSHKGQQGGFEGMLQKQWTIATCSAINLAAYKTGIRATSIGQGDNQVVILVYTGSQVNRRAELRRHFLEMLRKTFSELGLTLKMCETWMSKRLMEYGKRRWLNGIHVSQGTKRATRVILEESDGIPTLDSSLNMLSTATEAIANGDEIPDPAFIVYVTEVVIYLLRRNIITSSSPIDQVMAICLWPNILGGLPLSHLGTHQIRGLDDMLTVWLSTYRVIRELYPPVMRHLGVLIPLIRRSDLDYKRLVEDIFSLNIPTLQTANLVIKDHVKLIIPTFATNPEVLNVLALDRSETPLLIQSLVQMKPFYAPLAHEIYRNSNAGTIAQLQEKLTNVQSIIKAAQEYGDNDLFQLIRESDKRITHKIIRKFKLLTTSTSYSTSLEDYLLQIPCSYMLARKLRFDSWGIDPQGASHAVPWEQWRIDPFDDTPSNMLDISMITTSSVELVSLHRKALDVKGPYPYYFGTPTHVKTKSARLDFTTTHPFLESLKSLLYLYSWAKKIQSVYLCSLLKDLIRNKQGLLPPGVDVLSLLDQTETIYSGNLFHRMHCISESRGAMVNFLPSISTHIKTTTSSMERINRTGKDYNIFYQLTFLYVMSNINSLVYHDVVVSSEYRTYLNPKCHFCTHELEDSIMSDNQVHQTDDSHCPTTVCGPSQIIIPNVSLQQINISLTLKVAYDLSQEISDYTISAYAEKRLQGLVTAIHQISAVNIVELRESSISYLILGLFIYSKHLRDAIILSGRVSAKTSPSFLCQPIALAFSNAGRTRDLLLYLKCKNVTHSCTSSVSALAKAIWDGLTSIIDEHFSSIVSNIMKIRVFGIEGGLKEDHCKQLIIPLIQQQRRYLIECIDKHKNSKNAAKSVLSAVQLDSIKMLVIDIHKLSEDAYQRLYNILPDKNAFLELLGHGSGHQGACRNTYNILVNRGITEHYLPIVTAALESNSICICGHSPISLVMLVFFPLEVYPHFSHYHKSTKNLPRIKAIRYITYPWSDTDQEHSHIAEMNKYIDSLYKYRHLCDHSITQLQYLSYPNIKRILSTLEEIPECYNIIPRSYEYMSIKVLKHDDAVYQWRSGRIGEVVMDNKGLLPWEIKLHSKKRQIPESYYMSIRGADVSSLTIKPCIHVVPSPDSNHDDISYQSYSYINFCSLLSKPLGRINNSSNSLALILQEIPEVNPTIVINLAGGSGTNLVFLTHRFPDSLFLFNDGISLKNDQAIDYAFYTPSAVLLDGCIDWKTIYEDSYTLIHGCSDITDTFFAQKLCTKLQEKDMHLQRALIVIDIEARTPQSYEDLLRVLVMIISFIESQDGKCTVITHFILGSLIHILDELFPSHVSYVMVPHTDPQYTGFVTLLIYPKENSPSLPLLKTSDIQRSDCPQRCRYGCAHYIVHSCTLQCPTDNTNTPPISKELPIINIMVGKTIYDRSFRLGNRCLYKLELSEPTNTLGCYALDTLLTTIFSCKWEAIPTLNPSVTTAMSALGSTSVLMGGVEMLAIYIIIETLWDRNDLINKFHLIYRLLSSRKVSYNAGDTIQDNEIESITFHFDRDCPMKNSLLWKQKTFVRSCLYMKLTSAQTCKPDKLAGLDHFPPPIIQDQPEEKTEHEIITVRKTTRRRKLVVNIMNRLELEVAAAQREIDAFYTQHEANISMPKLL